MDDSDYAGVGCASISGPGDCSTAVIDPAVLAKANAGDAAAEVQAGDLAQRLTTISRRLSGTPRLQIKQRAAELDLASLIAMAAASCLRAM